MKLLSYFELISKNMRRKEKWEKILLSYYQFMN